LKKLVAATGDIVRENSKTIRQALFEELLQGSKTARELSQSLRISEKEVLVHLTHIEQSAGQKGYRFIIEPSKCLNCGFVFEKRERLKKPGKCPKCKNEFITNPSFGLKKAG
jgi:predicted Zn-ribbon and HTH transcriptional regulator